jgi:hypothetical protein
MPSRTRSPGAHGHSGASSRCSRRSRRETPDSSDRFGSLLRRCPARPRKTNFLTPQPQPEHFCPTRLAQSQVQAVLQSLVQFRQGQVGLSPQLGAKLRLYFPAHPAYPTVTRLPHPQIIRRAPEVIGEPVLRGSPSSAERAEILSSRCSLIHSR